MTLKQKLGGACVLLTLSVVGINSTQAAGFRLPEYSIYGIATANALVARDDIAALAVNPAGMSFLEGQNVTLNAYHLTYDLEVTTTSNNTTTRNAGEDAFDIPGLYISSELSKDWSVGFGVQAPFGLETKWPDNTFPGFLGVDSLDTELSRIKMVSYNPNLAVKLDNNTSIAFGINYYDVQELFFNTQAVTIQGSGNGLGWNAALQSHHGPLSIGLSYHHAVGTKLTGSYSSPTTNTPVRASLNLPSMFQLGIHYQITDSVGFEFDFERTGWSNFSSLEIINAQTGNKQSSSTNNWNDSNTYRSNLQLKLSDSSELNFGLAFDESPQPDEYYSARISDSDRTLYSLGYRHKFGNISVDFGYMHVDFKQRTFQANRTYVPSASSEPNGSSVYNGTYNAQADLFGLGLNFKF